MERILVALDGADYNRNAVDFAFFLARLTNSQVTGMFLEDIVEHGKPVPEHSGKPVSFISHADRPTPIETNVSLFSESCERSLVRYAVQRDHGHPSKQIVLESRYADIIVVDAQTSFHRHFEGVPTDFVREIMKESECPVIVAPESFDGIDEIVFAFNGSKSSMFAIKQFTYLFPELRDKKVFVMQIEEAGSGSLTEYGNFNDWLNGHYGQVEFVRLKGDAEAELFAQLIRKKNAFIVMGAYGRSALSRFFSHSHADLLIKAITQAIFITHY
ncbi:MAG: universal stress protein [Chitinophagaceae bacterium]